MASNPVRLQATVPTTSYQVPVTEQLGADAADPSYAGHVWQVQALLNGRPYGRNRGLSQIEWFVVPPIAVDPVKPSGGRPIAVVEWEVPYEEIRPGRPIKLQVPPIQEDTVLYVLRVRVPEKLSLQQLEQLRKNWAHEVRKEISAERTHQDTFVVQSYPPKRAVVYYLDGTPQDTAGAGVDRTRYRGGFFLYRVGEDTFAVQRWIPVRLRAFYLFPQDTAGVQGVFPGGYYLFGTPQDTAGAGVDRTRYTGGFFLFGMGQDTFGVQYGRYRGGFFLYRVGEDTFAVQRWIPVRLRAFYLFPQDTAGVQGVFPGGYYLFGTPQDTAGAGVDRTRYTGGFFLYRVGEDTFGVQYWPPKYAVIYDLDGTPQDTAGAGVAKTYYGKYTGGFFLFGMGQDTVPPTTSVLAPPTYTVWTTQPIGYPVEGGIVLGEFTPTHVGLPIPVPESISANVRRGTQGEIVVTFTQLH
jgi:hypothetical protein